MSNECNIIGTTFWPSRDNNFDLKFKHYKKEKNLLLFSFSSITSYDWNIKDFEINLNLTYPKIQFDVP